MLPCSCNWWPLQLLTGRRSSWLATSQPLSAAVGRIPLREVASLQIVTSDEAWGAVPNYLFVNLRVCQLACWRVLCSRGVYEAVLYRKHNWCCIASTIGAFPGLLLSNGFGLGTCTRCALSGVVRISGTYSCLFLIKSLRCKVPCRGVSRDLGCLQERVPTRKSALQGSRTDRTGSHILTTREKQTPPFWPTLTRSRCSRERESEREGSTGHPKRTT